MDLHNWFKELHNQGELNLIIQFNSIQIQFMELHKQNRVSISQ